MSGGDCSCSRICQVASTVVMSLFVEMFRKNMCINVYPYSDIHDCNLACYGHLSNTGDLQNATAWKETEG